MAFLEQMMNALADLEEIGLSTHFSISSVHPIARLGIESAEEILCCEAQFLHFSFSVSSCVFLLPGHKQALSRASTKFRFGLAEATAPMAASRATVFGTLAFATA